MSRYRTIKQAVLKGARWVVVRLVAHRENLYFVMSQFGPPASMGGAWKKEPLYAGDNLLLATDSFNKEVQHWTKKDYIMEGE